ncbi:MAG: hypothetical protein FJ100_22770 [Deltaproteobacteria bacterium]|nr:hypothetical protein [Deltaproteobacteria bacterium]
MHPAPCPARRSVPDRTPVVWSLWVVALVAVGLAACADSASTSSTDASGSQGSAKSCVGPTPLAAAFSAKPGPVIDPATAATPTQQAPVLGQKAPQFALTDQQPLSCGYKATYGLQTFAGKATLVALLAGW